MTALRTIVLSLLGGSIGLVLVWLFYGLRGNQILPGLCAAVVGGAVYRFLGERS